MKSVFLLESRLHYPYIDRGRGHQTRKPGGQGLGACLPGLTADTTVFAIGRTAEMKVHCARRQGIASKGCRGSGICCTLGTACRRRETSLRLAMPELDRQLHLTKVGGAVQTGFSMTRSRAIEFDKRMVRAGGEAWHAKPLYGPENCDFLHIFHNLIISKYHFLVLTRHLVNF